MRILVHGYLGWYGSMAQWVFDGLESLGHEVYGCDRLQKPNQIDEVDLYIAVDSSEDFSANIPQKIKAPGVYWAMDTHMPGGLQRGCNMARGCDMVFSTNYEHGVEILRQNGVESTLLPITFNELYLPEKPIPIEGRKYDVVMIGNPNSNERVQLWNILNSSFNAFTGRIESKEDFISVMSSAKIVVNQPTEPWDIILNNRFFEAMGFGAVLFQKNLKTSLMSRLGFEAGVHYQAWNDMTTISDVISFYLNSPDLLKNMAYKGEVAVQKYKLTNQLNTMLSLITSKFYDRL